MVGSDTFLYPLKDQFQVSDKVYEQLRKAILNRQLKPGDRLVERKLAEQFAVSRTPIREAIRRLELDGLVSHFPRIGAVIAQIDKKEVIEVYRIRAVLEGLAAQMAAERINPEQLDRLTELINLLEEAVSQEDLNQLEKLHREFNDIIYKAANSPRLYDMITSLVDFIDTFARVGYCYPGRITEATKEHRQLVEAIKLRDGDLAERVCREHINNSKQAYFAEIDEIHINAVNKSTGKEPK